MVPALTDTKELFAHTWREAVKDQLDRSPSYKLDDFIATGRAGVEYGGKRNAQWWLDHGPEMVDRWVAWRQETGWEIWEYEPHQPAIEMELRFDLPNGIPVLAFIDRVFVLPTGELAVHDIKTGRIPETGEQLGLYATGLEILGYPRPKWGYFWDAQKGTHGDPIDLDMFTPGFFAELFGGAVAGINAGSFLPKAQNACRNWCGVAQFCALVGGEKAASHDTLARVDIDNGGEK